MKDKTGRPHKYEPWLTDEGLTLVKGWYMEGMTDDEVARRMGINRATLYRWKKELPKFREATARGKEVADYAVEQALYRRAIGYTYEEKKIKCLDDGRTEKTITIKEVVPDVQAASLWLRNRRPDKWRDHPDYEAGAAALEKLDAMLEEFRAAVNESPE